MALERPNMHIEQLEGRQYFTGANPSSYAGIVSTTIPAEVVAGYRIHANVVVQWDGAGGFLHVGGVGYIELGAFDGGTHTFLIRKKIGRLNLGERPHRWVIPIWKIPSSIPPGAYTLSIYSANNGVVRFSVGPSPFSFTVIQPTKP